MKIGTLLVSLLLLNACGNAYQNLRQASESESKSLVRSLGLVEDGELVEVSYRIARTRKDEEWTDEEVLTLCEDSARDRKMDEATEVLEVKVSDVQYTKNCYQRNFQRTCYKWFQGIRLSCQATMKKAKSNPGEQK